MNEWRNEYDEYNVIMIAVVMNDVSFELMMDMKRELSEILKIMKSYWLLIEWFWMMVFVGVSHFEGSLLFINMDWGLLFSFHLIDVTGWIEELIKNGKDMKSELSVSHSTHLCVVSSVWWNGCSSHCVSVSNRFTWTGVPPWPHVYEWCETPHCLWLWMRWSVWGECDDYWTSIPLTM